MASEGKTTFEGMTIKEAAERWGKSISAVKKYVSQGRVDHKRMGGGPQRAGTVIITQEHPPRAMGFGELRPEQRAAWPKKRLEKVVAPKAAKKTQGIKK